MMVQLFFKGYKERNVYMNIRFLDILQVYSNFFIGLYLVQLVICFLIYFQLI